MDRDSWDLEPDSVQRALDALTPRSGGQVMREAFYGTRRFDGFLRRTGLTAPVLSSRLRELERAEMLYRVPYREPNSRTRHEYRLTPRGRDLAVAIVALLEWADRWLPGPDGPTILLRHRKCGGEVRAQLACAEGHPDLPIAAVELVPGPGARRRRVNLQDPPEVLDVLAQGGDDIGDAASTVRGPG